ncbi:MAG: hypothetical protein ACFB20_07370 [Opitutales bacterium]
MRQVAVRGIVRLETPAGEVEVGGFDGALTVDFPSIRCLLHVRRRLKRYQRRLPKLPGVRLQGEVRLRGRLLAAFTWGERLRIRPCPFSFLFRRDRT